MIRAPSYDPTQFLELAEQLLEDIDYEEMGRSRTVTGRAYYAAFLMVKKKLEELGCSFVDAEKIHQEVIETANERNSMIGGKLDTLRGYRVDADYHMDKRVDRTIAGKCSRISQIILNMLDQLK